MKDKVGIYFYVEEGYGSYKLNYVIKNITTGKIFIKIRKPLRNEEHELVAIESLEYLLNNVLSLIKLNEINKDVEVNIFTDNSKTLEILNNREFKEIHKNLKFFLDKIDSYKCKEFKKIKGFVQREKKAPLAIYVECKKVGKEYRKLLKRSSTLPLLREKIKVSKNIVFFDFEMNCLMDFKSVEIVSVGACKLNLETGEVSRFYSLVKPKDITELTEKCIEITALNQEEIDNAKDFNEVFSEFKEWVSDEEALYLYWGGNDITVLKNDYRRNGMLSDIAINIQKNNIDFQEVLCKDVLEKEDMLSLTNGLLEFEIDFDGSQHNSGDDAYNLYRMYMEWKKNHS